MRFRILSGLLAACAFSVASPSMTGPPKEIFGYYRLPDGGFVRVTPHAGNRVRIALKLYYASGHTCRLANSGEWRDRRVEVVTPGIDPNQPCKLEAYFYPDRIVLEDNAGRCAAVYCGTRGKLDGVILPRRNGPHP